MWFTLLKWTQTRLQMNTMLPFNYFKAKFLSAFTACFCSPQVAKKAFIRGLKYLNDDLKKRDFLNFYLFVSIC